MHAVVERVAAQARMAGLPPSGPIPHRCPNEVTRQPWRSPLRTLFVTASHTSLSAICTSKMCVAIAKSGWPAPGSTERFPCGGCRPPRLAEEMIDKGLRARLSCIDTRVLDTSFAGRAFDRSLLNDLAAACCPCGENGEFHTCVSAGPMFANALDLETGEVVTREPFVWTDLELRQA